MAIVKTLDILLRGKTGMLGRDLKKGLTQIKSFSSSVGRSVSGAFGKVAAIGGAITGIVSLAAAVKKVNDQFTVLDRLGKVADSLGLTVREMQNLSMAASMAGIEMSSLESIMTATSKIAAGKGSKKQTDALNEIGINPKALEGMNGSEALTAITDAIAELGTEAQKTAAKSAIFGKSMADLATQALGSDAVAKASSDIEAYGLALTRIDTAQVEVANDAWTKLQAVMDGVWQKIAVQLAPAFTALIETFLEGKRNASGFTDAIIGGFENMVAGIGVIARSWEFMVGVFQLGMTVINGGLALILNEFARVESMLMRLATSMEGISFAGFEMPDASSFDFGAKAMAAEAAKMADESAKKMKHSFGQAFGENDFENKFQSKMAEARSKADQSAKDSAENAKKRFAPRNLIDWDKMKKMAEETGAKLSVAGSEALGTGRKFLGIGTRKATDDTQKPKAAAALTRFSAEAQSAINTTKVTTEATIQKTHKEAQKVRERQESALRDIGRTLASGSGVIVSLAGGGR